MSKLLTATVCDYILPLNLHLALSIPPSSPLQEEVLSEVLAEVKALRSVVLAQGQRIELLERQLARIEDGDV